MGDGQGLMTADRQPMTPAERTARHRARKRDGVLGVDGIEITPEVVEKLIQADWTTPEEMSDRKRLSDVVSNILDCWVRGTLSPPR